MLIRTICAGAITIAVMASPSWAQSKEELAAAQLRYQQDMADCKSHASAEEMANCTLEARNSLAEIKRGRMHEAEQPSDYEKNALQRCDVHQGIDRTACIERMQGRGHTEGSVASGGILREIETIIPN
jgi:hypothetical protein